MTLAEIAERLGWEAASPSPTDSEVTGAIASDLLSDILGSGAPGYIWLTIQTHRNVAAVALAQELAAVVVTNGRQPSPDLVELAAGEGVPIYLTEDPTFLACGQLYELGVRV